MRNTQKVQKSKIEQLKLISNSGYEEDNIQMMFKIVDGKTHIHLEPKKKILINGEEKNQLIIDEPTIEKALRKFMEMLLSSNPTVLESLFIPEDKILYEHPIMTEIKKYRNGEFLV